MWWRPIMYNPRVISCWDRHTSKFEVYYASFASSGSRLFRWSWCWTDHNGSVELRKTDKENEEEDITLHGWHCRDNGKSVGIQVHRCEAKTGRVGQAPRSLAHAPLHGTMITNCFFWYLGQRETENSGYWRLLSFSFAFFYFFFIIFLPIFCEWAKTALHRFF